MAWHTDLTPAWPNPSGRSRRSSRAGARSSRLVGGGAVWTPVTVDASTEHRLLRHRLGDAALLPVAPAGPNPRTDSLIAVDLQHRQAQVVAAADRRNQWSTTSRSRRSSTTARSAGKTRRVVSVATMEGVWFAFDAKTGAPFYQRVKVIDRIEHPALQPGQAGDGLPLERSAASTTRRPPTTRRRTTCSTRPPRPPASTPGEADADAEEAQVRARRRLPRARQRQLRHRARGLARPRLDQRDRRQHRQARLEVRDARARARRRHDDRQRRSASPAAATACCAPSTRKTGKVLWTFQTGAPDRGRADDLLGRRQGVRRDHRRRHAHLVGRRRLLAAAGLRARRLEDASPAAAAVVPCTRGRCRPRRRGWSRRRGRTLRQATRESRPAARIVDAGRRSRSRSGASSARTRRS